MSGLGCPRANDPFVCLHSGDQRGLARAVLSLLVAANLLAPLLHAPLLQAPLLLIGKGSRLTAELMLVPLYTLFTRKL